MGTRGYKVYRRRGWYFVYYNHYDSYPEGLGVEVMAEIPVGEEEYNGWLSRRREQLDLLFEENQAVIEQLNSRFYITRKRPVNTLYIEWIYEIDFDHEVFLVDSCPLFSLKNMPPSADLFCAYIGFDSYGHRGYSPSTLKQHIYEWTSAPPEVADSVIDEYAARHDRCELAIADLLGTTAELSDAESARIGLFEVMIGGCMLPPSFGINLRHLETVSSPADIPRFLLCWGEQILRLSFGCMLLGYVQKLTVIEPAGLGFWLTSNVFVQMTTHLNDERNLKKNIIDVVNEIARQRQTPTPVYGVLFSFFHCVVLEVDAQNKFKSTPALQFLPSLYTASPSTPGIAAIARLAHHRLSSLEILGRISSLLPPDHFLHNVPLDILECVAAMLSPLDLENLCSAAPVFKSAAERLLRYPHINGYRLERVLEWPSEYSVPDDGSANPRMCGNLFSAWVDGALLPQLQVNVTRPQGDQYIFASEPEAEETMVVVAFAAAVQEED